MHPSDRRGLLLPALLLAGCSVTGPRVQSCTESAECREAFGLLWTCGAEGYCSQAEVHPRCTLSYPADLLQRPEDYPDLHILGAMADVTADLLEVQAMMLPFTQADDQGGLEGSPVGLVACTYESDTRLDGLDYDEAVVETGSYLVDVLGVSGVIGPVTSGTTTTLYTELVEARGEDLFILSPSATSPALTYLDGYTKTDAEPGLLWRTCPPDSLQGQAAASFLLDEGRERVAVVFQTGPYGSGLAEAFLDHFVAGGAHADAYEFDSGTGRDVAVSTVAEAGSYEAVFFISSEVSDIIDFLNFFTAYSAEYAGTDFTILLADGAADVQLIDETPAAEIYYDQIRGTRPAVPPSALYDSFAGSYISAYGQDASGSIYTAYAYDASWLALYSLAWSTSNEGGLSGLGMARGMRQVSEGIEVEIRPTGWAAATAAFEEGQSIDVVGVSGELDYDEQTGETSSPIEIWTINKARDGFDVIQTVYP